LGHLGDSAAQAFDAFMGAVAILARPQKPAKGTPEGNKMFDGVPGDVERLVMLVDLSGVEKP
jgi:hypothetical protein